MEKAGQERNTKQTFHFFKKKIDAQGYERGGGEQ